MRLQVLRAHHSVNLALYLTLGAGCVRQFETVQPPEAEPAFLGPASGLYLVEAKPDIDLPQRIAHVLQTRGRLLVAVRGLLEQEGLADLYLDQKIEVDSMTQERTVSSRDTRLFSAIHPTLARAFFELANEPLTVDIKITLGLDALGVTMQIVEDAQYQAFCGVLASVAPFVSCAALQAPLAMRADKICDFDSRVSGVYHMELERTQATAACQEKDRLDGEREWLVTTGTAGEGAAIVSLDGVRTEFVVALKFQTEALLLYEPVALPFGSRPLMVGEFVGDVRVSSSVIKLVAEFTRQVAGGCEERYLAVGDRLNGTQPGKLCGPTDLCNAVRLAGCPALPSQLTGVYRIDGELQSPGAVCPVPMCSLLLPRASVCEPASDPIALNGCTAGTTLYLQTKLRTTGERCAESACLPAPACAANQPLGAEAPPCASSDWIRIKRVGRCSYLACDNP